MSLDTWAIGRPKTELDTPALLVDLPTMERNIDRMARYMRDAGVGWRPHTKALKTPALAHMLLRAGAHGVTCAKLGEAEVMAAGGVRDVMVAVDGEDNVRAIDAAARAKGVRLRVLIEVNIGMHRAGVEPGDAVVHLARLVRSE